MKKFILTALICLMAGVVCGFDDGKDPDNLIPKEYPQYLLVYRLWETGSCESSPDMLVYGCQSWVYYYEPYASVNAVVKKLNNWRTWTYDGNVGLENKDVIIGLWKLDGADGNIFDKTLKQRIVKHTRKVRIEEQGWAQYVWENK